LKSQDHGSFRSTGHCNGGGLVVGVGCFIVTLVAVVFAAVDLDEMSEVMEVLGVVVFVTIPVVAFDREEFVVTVIGGLVTSVATVDFNGVFELLCCSVWGVVLISTSVDDINVDGGFLDKVDVFPTEVDGFAVGNVGSRDVIGVGGISTILKSSSPTFDIPEFSST